MSGLPAWFTTKKSCFTNLLEALDFYSVHQRYCSHYPVQIGNLHFTDDSRIFSIVKSLDDTAEFQKDLDNIQRWSSRWLLKLNSSKCKTMHIGQSLGGTYYISDQSTPGSYVYIRR